MSQPDLLELEKDMQGRGLYAVVHLVDDPSEPCSFARELVVRPDTATNSSWCIRVRYSIGTYRLYRDEHCSAYEAFTFPDLVYGAILDAELKRRRNEVKPAITKAFRALRRQGMVARQKYQCCQSCALCMLGKEDLSQHAGGYVFYHKQDAEYFDGERTCLHIRYGTITESTDKDVVGVGRRVRAALEAAGLTVLWWGDPAQTIRVV